MTMSTVAMLLVLAAQTTTPAPPSSPPAPAAQANAAPADQQVTPPPEFIQAAQAFGQCVGAGASALAPTVTPEAGASQVVAGCATQKTALETRFEAWVASPGFPEEGRAPARAQFATQIGGVEAQIANRIRAGRAAPAATPTPSPTPSPGR